MAFLKIASQLNNLRQTVHAMRKILQRIFKVLTQAVEIHCDLTELFSIEIKENSEKKKYSNLKKTLEEEIYLLIN